MPKFDDIINLKYSQLNEAGEVAPAGAATATTVQNPQQQQQTQQQDPATQLAAILGKIPFNQPEVATKMLNTAAADVAKTNPQYAQHFNNFFSNIGYANGQFAYKAPQAQQSTPQAAPSSAPQSAPKAASTSSASAPIAPIGSSVG